MGMPIPNTTDLVRSVDITLRVNGIKHELTVDPRCHTPPGRLA